jgi:Ca2+-binding EF-hand superfamily protein
MSKDRDHDIEMHFRYVDSDGNGLIDIEEFRVMLNKMGTHRSSDVIAHAFKAIDSDSSGHIDLQEFTHWWSRQTGSSTAAIPPLADDGPEP